MGGISAARKWSFAIVSFARADKLVLAGRNLEWEILVGYLDRIPR